MMVCWWRHCLHFLLLAVLQTPSGAYISVNLAQYCLPEGPPSVLHLQSKGPRAAVFVNLNVRNPYTSATERQTGATRCLMEVTAPPEHLLVVHLDHPKKLLTPKSPAKRQGFIPCTLKLSHTGQTSDDIDTLHKVASRTFDLCNSSRMTVDTLFLTNHLSLAWSPPDASLAGTMVTKRLVITAVGRGMDVCDSRHRFFCLGSGIHFPLCIPTELACDGYNNCPNVAYDEDPEDCGAMALKGSLFLSDPNSSEEGRDSESHVVQTLLTKAVLQTLSEDKSDKRDVTSTTLNPGQDKQSGFELSTSVLRDMSDIILKKLMSRSKNAQVTETRNTSTTTTTGKPPWQDNAEDGTLPAALAHYGPWGYMMLGMLICGAVLMLCGLWECCCRSSNQSLPTGGPTSTSAATTVFIINSTGGIGNRRRNSAQPQAEAPPTPGPPSYEELDQPPSYSSLFPMTKIEPVTVDENRLISGQHI